MKPSLAFKRCPKFFSGLQASDGLIPEHLLESHPILLTVHRFCDLEQEAAVPLELLHDPYLLDL